MLNSSWGDKYMLGIHQNTRFLLENGRLSGGLQINARNEWSSTYNGLTMA